MGGGTKRTAVIGAGVSGVATAAHLRAAGVDVTVFERTSSAGGVWVYDPQLAPEPAYPSIVPSLAENAFFHEVVSDNNKAQGNNGTTNSIRDLRVIHAPPGPAYECLQNNVPTGLMELKLNNWPPGTEQIVKHNVLAEYIQNTASKTGVHENTIYNTKVTKLSKKNNKWQVETSTLDDTRHGTPTRTLRTWEFDAVVVATGHYQAPKVPSIPGLQDWKEHFPSRIRHSKRYRSPKEFKDKYTDIFRTVLLIGGSTSSTDIAKELEGIAKNIYQSTRNGKYDMPVSMLPPSAKRVSEVTSFSLKQPPKRLLSDCDAIPGTVTLVDRQVISDIDDVIIATGYHFTLPFLSEYHRDDIKAEEADEKVLITDGVQMHNLHKDIFYIPDPTLAFVGVPFYIATFTLYEFQAIAVAAVLSGRAALPTEALMRAEYNSRVEQKGFGREFHSLMGKDADYANELLAWINPGIVASGEAPVQGHSEEWKEKYGALWAALRAKRAESQEKVPPHEILGTTKTSEVY